MTSPSAHKTFPAEVLTPAEVQALISACSAQSRTGVRNRALLTLLYRSGLRISEVVGIPAQPERRFTGPDGEEKIQPAREAIPPLKPADVDLGKHTVRVLHGKGNKATTAVSIPARLTRWPGGSTSAASWASRTGRCSAPCAASRCTPST